MAIKNLNEIEKSLGLSEGTLKGAIENEAEVEVDIAGVVIHKKEEFDNLVVRTKDEDQQRMGVEYGKGKTAGEEMLMKKVREDEGLDEGLGKDPNAIIGAIKSKALADAKVNPDERVSELEKANGLLVKEKETLATQLATKESEFKNQLFARDQKDGVRRDIGDVKTLLPKNRLADIFFLDHEVKLGEDGKERFIKKATGEVIDNPTTHAPEVRANVVKNWMTENKFFVVDGGGGGGDEGAAGEGTMAAFKAEMKEKGIGEGSLQYSEELNKRVKDGTLQV
jgi:hypothetical protein